MAVIHDFKERMVDSDGYDSIREFHAPNGKTYQFCEHSIYVHDEVDMHWEFLVYHWIEAPTAESIWMKMVELGIFSEDTSGPA